MFFFNVNYDRHKILFKIDLDEGKYLDISRITHKELMVHFRNTFFVKEYNLPLTGK